MYALESESEVELTEALPEYMPDVTALVRVDCTPGITDIKVEGGRINAEGEASFTLLYQSGYGLKLNTASFTKRFSVAFTPKAGTFDHRCRAKAELRSVTCRLSDARTPVLKAKVGVKCDVRSCVAKKCVDTESSGTTFFKRKAVMLPIPGETARSVNTCTGEIMLTGSDAAVGEIVLSNVSIQTYSADASEGCVVFRGSANARAVYEVESGNAYRSVSKSIPFGFEVSLASVNAGSEIDADVHVSSFSLTAVMDNYGENRRIMVSFDICSDICVTDRREYTLAEDLFTPGFRSETVYAEAEYPTETLTEKKNYTFDIRTERGNVPFDEIYDASCRVTKVECEKVDGGAELKIRAVLSLLGKRGDGFESTDTNAELTEFFPTGICENAEPEVGISIVEVIPSLMSDGSVACRVPAEVKMVARRTDEVKFVSEVTKEEQIKQADEGVTAVYYFPAEGDTLWSVAKHFGADPGAILSSGGSAFDENGCIMPDTKCIFINI